jgi:hypothetical protein
MALGIYTDTTPSTECSQDGSFSNPITASADGLHGQTVVKKLYVRNDDATKIYESNEVSLVDNGDNIVDGTLDKYGFTWKLYASDDEPIDAQWDTVSPGNTISLADLLGGDTSTYLPFWLRITVPAFASVKAYQDVQLSVSTQESGV